MHKGRAALAEVAVWPGREPIVAGVRAKVVVMTFLMPGLVRHLSVSHSDGAHSADQQEQASVLGDLGRHGHVL